MVQQKQQDEEEGQELFHGVWSSRYQRPGQVQQPEPPQPSPLPSVQQGQQNEDEGGAHGRLTSQSLPSSEGPHQPTYASPPPSQRVHWWDAAPALPGQPYQADEAVYRRVPSQHLWLRQAQQGQQPRPPQPFPPVFFQHQEENEEEEDDDEPPHTSQPPFQYGLLRQALFQQQPQPFQRLAPSPPPPVLDRISRPSHQQGEQEEEEALPPTVWFQRLAQTHQQAQLPLTPHAQPGEDVLSPVHVQRQEEITTPPAFPSSFFSEDSETLG
ncbi:hypothetical protein CSUI_009596 [Cystoisospora suis]|uniref:Uncharacterized protein n=1 Tax=Cystoisospora suis TaxID=483139 RepID=A0A2C6KIX0_9APIC|nr:hypothetical protein CSUI_009596 [Cystoisospora suis]